jgi:hypothetical protein
MTATLPDVAATARAPSSLRQRLTWFVLALLPIFAQGGAGLAGGAEPGLSSLFEHVAVAGGDELRRLVQRQDAAGLDQNDEHEFGPDVATDAATSVPAVAEVGRPVAPSTPTAQPSSDGRYRRHAPRGPPTA